MEQYILLGALAVFWAVEVIRKAAKKKGGGVEAPGSSGDSRPEWEFEWANKPAEELPTYDEDPSYDDGPTYDERPSHDDRLRTGEEPSRSAQPRSQRRPSAETMLPSDLLEELAALATGRGEPSGPRTVETPRQSPPLPGQRGRPEVRPEPRPRPAPERAPSRGPVRTPGTHRVHLAHKGYGTDPSERAPSEQDGLDPLAVTLSEDARSVHRQLLSADPHALRQAIVLREVLGKPLALRDEEG